MLIRMIITSLRLITMITIIFNKNTYSNTINVNNNKIQSTHVTYDIIVVIMNYNATNNAADSYNP